MRPPSAVGYVLMGYPRVSETFIASEVLRVERAGVPLRLFVIKPVEERERALRHPVVDAIRARPEYLPDTSSLTLPLHMWRPAHLRPFMPALRRAARQRPRGLLRATRIALGEALRNRRSFWAGPRKVNDFTYVADVVAATRRRDGRCRARACLQRGRRLHGEPEGGAGAARDRVRTPARSPL